MAMLFWAKGVLWRRLEREQLKAWRKQTCETLDLGVKWPQWQTMPFEEQMAVDMRVVCPQEFKHMHLKQARMV